MITLDRVRVAPIVEKIVETCLMWFVHVETRLVDSVVLWRVVKSLEAEKNLEKPHEKRLRKI